MVDWASFSALWRLRIELCSELLVPAGADGVDVTGQNVLNPEGEIFGGEER